MESNTKNPSNTDPSNACCKTTRSPGMSPGKVIGIILIILVIGGLTLGMKIATLNPEEHDKLNRWLRSLAPTNTQNTAIEEETVIVTQVQTQPASTLAPAAQQAPEITSTPTAAPASQTHQATPTSSVAPTQAAGTEPSAPADIATQTWVHNLVIDSFVYRANHSKFSIGANIYTLGAPIPSPYNLTWIHVSPTTPGHYVLTFSSSDGSTYKKQI